MNKKKHVALFSIDIEAIKDGISWKGTLIQSLKESLRVILETGQFKKVGSLRLVNIVTERTVHERFIEECFPVSILAREITLCMDTPVLFHKTKDAWTKADLLVEADDGDTFVVALLSKEGCRKIELSTLEVPDIPTRNSGQLSCIKVFD